MKTRTAGSRQSHYPGVDEYALRVVRCKAVQLVGRAGFTGADVPDIVQELVLDLLDRIPKYDPARGRFSTFVSRVVDHKVAELLKPRYAAKRDFRRNGASLDDAVDDGDGARVERGETLSQEDQVLRAGPTDRETREGSDLRVDVASAVERLPPELRELCRWLLHYSLSEVSRATGTPRTTLQYRLKEVAVRFEAAGLGAYLPGAGAPRGAFGRSHSDGGR